MLSHLEVHHFQSLHNVSLEFGRLTVIVGPSSSGKSALTRALRTLVSNARGASFVTTGEQTSTIIATVDNGIVSLKRGKENEYTLIPNDPNSLPKTFTKLGGAVPDEVTEFIGIQSKDPINFAGQFDMPYLLDDSAGTNTARVLGSLTNVSLIFEAAREANRLKSNTSSTLKVKANDLAVIKEKSKTYFSLKSNISSLEEAEEHINKADSLATQLRELETAAETISLAQRQLSSQQDLADISLPSLDRVLLLNNQLSQLKDLITTYQKNNNDRNHALNDLTDAANALSALEVEYTQVLKDAGTCPTCQQSTKELEHTHND